MSHHSFIKRPVHPSFGRVKRIWTGRNMEDGLWTGKKMKEQKKKRCSKTIDIVSYALKVSVNGAKCVFVALFRSSGTI